MDSEAETQTVIETLNGKAVDGRNLTVNEARLREDRGGGGGRGGEADMAAVAVNATDKKSRASPSHRRNSRLCRQ